MMFRRCTFASLVATLALTLASGFARAQNGAPPDNTQHDDWQDFGAPVEPMPATPPSESTEQIAPEPAPAADPPPDNTPPEPDPIGQETHKRQPVEVPVATPTPHPSDTQTPPPVTIDVLPRKTERITLTSHDSAAVNFQDHVNRVEVVDPNIAEVYVESPRRVLVTGREPGTTQLVVQSNGHQRLFSITVMPNLDAVQNLIASVSPTADVSVHSIGGNIVLTGRAPDIETIAQIEQIAGVSGATVVNQIRVAGVHQIMLRVVVAEVNREAIRRLGVNWAIGASDFSRDFFFANNLGQLNPTVFSNSGVANVRTGQQIFALAPNANGATTNLTFGFPRAEFQIFVDALRENSLARILAEPNLAAISGQTATFLAGGEVPLSVVSSTGGTSTVSIIYKEFGVRLGFTPTSLGGQMIRLHVLSEVSEPVPSSQTVGGLPVFSFNTRRVETTVECGNSQTFAIAGLLNEEIRGIASKIPGLGDVPVLGTLFSSVDYQRDVTELVVLVTPELVEALEPQQLLPPPGAGMQPPTDAELFGLQLLEGRAGIEPDTHVEMEPMLDEDATEDSNRRAGPAPATETMREVSDPKLYAPAPPVADDEMTAVRGPWGFEESMADTGADR